MKESIITFHFAHNYGAVLQTWALQKCLSDYGNEVSVIDYRPSYHQERYAVKRSCIRAFTETYNISKKNAVTRAVRGLRSMVGIGLENIRLKKHREKRSILFESFVKKHINTTRYFESLEEIQCSDIDADILIAGSDQIWNRKLTEDKFDDAYFLQFGLCGAERVIYAASLGETPSIDCEMHIKQLENPIDYISCREEADANTMSKGLQRECDFIPDPTLLLDCVAYKEIEEELELPERYILVYILKQNEELEKSIKIVKDALKIPIINISPISISVPYCDVSKIVSPGEFVYCFGKASFVITNSFHGTVFSCIYHKEFIVGKNKNRNLRMESLLESLSLSKRMISSEDEVNALIMNSIDYTHVDKKMQNERNKGIGFLSKTGAINKNDE